MNVTRATAGAAVLGGLVWVVGAALAWGQDVSAVATALGLLGLLVALAGVGYSLVETAPVWLRAVVSAATPLLGYGVWATLVAAFDDSALPVLLSGLVMLAVGGTAWARGRETAPADAPVHGRRAAR
jgi:hypothetical protein